MDAGIISKNKIFIPAFQSSGLGTGENKIKVALSNKYIADICY
jgi:hypothetical protein